LCGPILLRIKSLALSLNPSFVTRTGTGNAPLSFNALPYRMGHGLQAQCFLTVPAMHHACNAFPISSFLYVSPLYTLLLDRVL